MSTVSTASRLAGEAMKEFHGIGSQILGEKVVSALGGRLGDTASKFIGPTVQLGGSALVAGAENILSPITNKRLGDNPEFARQMYRPGTLPLTNEQAGYLYLDQMKLQNQMALLQARQELSANPGIPQSINRQAVSSFVPDNLYGSLARTINTTYSY